MNQKIDPKTGKLTSSVVGGAMALKEGVLTPARDAVYLAEILAHQGQFQVTTFWLLNGD